MNISKINPIGYQTQTEQGNTYKKSNAGKAGMLVTAAAINASPYIFKNNPVAKLFSTKYLIKDLASSFNKKIPQKWEAPLAALGIGLDLVFFYLMGASIDKSINKKRAAKADETAQTVDNK